MSSPFFESEPRPTQAEWLQVPSIRSAWCVVAAFGTYACMYGFRKPFTAGTYPGIDGMQDLKVWLVAAQALGYLGYVAVRLARRLWTAEDSILQFFNTITLAGAAVGILAMTAALLAFRHLRSSR